MDASQLSLFLTARIQSSSKMTLQLGEDSNSSDKIFAELLKKHAAEQSETERQAELDRQNWRSQPPRYTPGSVASTSSTTSSSTDSSSRGIGSSNTNNSTPSSSPTRATRQTTRSENNTTTGRNPTQGASTKAASSQDRSNTASAQKADKTKGASSDDDNQAADGQAASTAADGTTPPKHQATSDNMPGGGGSSGNGQGQNQSGQDDPQKQSQQADSSNDGTAVAESVEAGVLASLMMGQSPLPNTTLAGQAATGGVQAAAGAGPGSTLLPGSGIQGSTQGTAGGQDSLASAAAQANTALTNGLSSAGTAAAGANIAANEGLPETNNVGGTTGVANRPSQQDLASAFTSMVNKSASQTASNSDASRISISRPDNAPQMPKPLVKIDNDHTTLSGSASASASSESDTASGTAITTLDANVTASDDGGDDFRTFGSYSPLLAGGTGSILAAKQADPLATLRQQLASASVQDQIAVHMQKAAKDSVDKISIQLSPTELGQIHVKMKVDDDKNVTATITVERPSTLDLLQRDTKTLERALQEAGLKTDTGSLSFSLQRGNEGDSSGTPGGGQGKGNGIGSAGQENNASLAEISAATAGNEVDTANGLVNVAV